MAMGDVFQAIRKLASNGLTRGNPPTDNYRQVHFGGFPSYNLARFINKNINNLKFAALHKSIIYGRKAG